MNAHRLTPTQQRYLRQIGREGRLIRQAGWRSTQTIRLLVERGYAKTDSIRYYPDLSASLTPKGEEWFRSWRQKEGLR